MKTKEELAEEYVNNLIPLGHERCSSDFFQEIQKAAFLAGYESNMRKLNELLIDVKNFNQEDSKDVD